MRVWDLPADGRILAVRLDGMGDALMTGPALRALKGLVPKGSVTALVSPMAADCARRIPGVDQVLIHEAPWMKIAAAAPAADRALIDRLGAQAFDAAVIFTVYSQSPLPAALVCYLAGIPRRLAHCRENPYHLLTDWVAETEPHHGIRHEVRRQLDLVATIGAAASDESLALTVPEPALAWAAQWRPSRGPLVVIHPGAQAPSRRYPAESYATVVRLLEQELGAHCLITGRESERALLAEVKSGAVSGARILCEGSFDQLAAVIRMADIMITNNTGPAHMAAALGTPVVVLYALTNPQHEPWQAAARVLSADVPCRNCYKSVCPSGHHRCLRDVSPRAVVDAAHALWHAHAPPARRALC